MFIIILIPGWNSCAWIQCVGKVPLKMKLDTVSRISFQQPESVIVPTFLFKKRKMKKSYTRGKRPVH